MEERSRRSRIEKGISEIPMELGLKICKHLNATDLVNLCEAVPRWKWVLNTSPFSHVVCESIEDWKWLDRHLCQLLFGGDAEIAWTNATLATVYRNQQDAIFQRLSRTEFPEHTQRPVSCLFLTSTSDVSRLRDDVKQYHCNLQVVNTGPPTRILFDVVSDATHFKHDWNGFSHVSGESCLQKLQDITGSGTEVGKRRRLTDYDCVILDVDYGDTIQLHADMDDLLSGMTPRQTLITTGSLLHIKGLVSNLDCMEEMFWSLGGLEFSLLSQISANWRIWCNQHQNHFAIDFVEVMRWACLDVFSRQGGKTLHC